MKRFHISKKMFWGMASVLCLCAVAFTSCYKFSAVTFSSHEIAQGENLTVTAILGTDGYGETSVDFYGMFAVRVPSGWDADELPSFYFARRDGVQDREGCSVLECPAYAALLNKFYPKEGYKWIGFRTDVSDELTLNGDQAMIVTASLKAGEQTGDFRLDFAVGCMLHDPYKKSNPDMLLNGGKLDIKSDFILTNSVVVNGGDEIKVATLTHTFLATTIAKEEYERHLVAFLDEKCTAGDGKEYPLYPSFTSGSWRANIEGASGCDMTVKVVAKN